MSGHDPEHAFRIHIRSVREALQCIMSERLSLGERAARITAGALYAFNIGLRDPALLRVEAEHPEIGIIIAQSIRIVGTGSRWRHERFTVQVVRYFYALVAEDRQEILAFHWTPETTDPNQRTFPHLHVGAINLNANSPIRPGTFHKIHIPTSHVSVESVIRMAITELNVRPLRPDWEQVLMRTERSRGVAHDHPA